MAKRKGTCEGCFTPGKMLTQIESGQFLCNVCMRELRPPPPTQQQIERARRIGFTPPEDVTRDQLGPLLRLYEEVKHYTYDVWECIAGLRPNQCNVPLPVLYQLMTAIVIKWPEKAEAIVAIQKARLMATGQAVSDAMEAMSESEAASFRPDWKSYKVPPPRDEIYQFIETSLRRTCGEYIPGPWKRTTSGLFRKLFR